MKNRTMLRGLYSFILISMLISFLECSRKEEPAAGGPAGLGQGSSTSTPSVDLRKHYELTGETTVLDAAKVVRAVSPDHTEYTLDSSATEARDLAPGKVLLIPGVDAGKVEDVRQEGGKTVVKLGPARITDIIRNGTLQWGPEDIDTGRGSWVVRPEGSKVALFDPRPGPGTYRAAIWDGGTLAPFLIAASGVPPQADKIDLTVGEYKISLRFRTDSITLAFTKQSGSKGSFNLWEGGSVEVKLGKPKGSGAVKVHNGSLQNYTFTMPVDGFVKMDITAKSSEARAFPEAALVEIPAQWVVPLDIYGVPCYMGLGVKFLIQPSIAAKETGVGIQLRVDFGGDIGFHYTDGSLETATSLNSPAPESPLTGIIAVPSVGSLALLFAVQAPRYSFGIGVSSVFTTGSFVDMVTSVGVAAAPATSLLQCRQLTLSQVVGGGIEYEIGPEVFQTVLKNFQKKMKLKAESKIEFFRKDSHWYNPAGCAPK